MYIQIRRRVWHALQEIPPELRPIIGRARFCRSLRTSDPVTAKRRAAALEAQWLTELARARRLSKALPENAAEADADAEWWRSLYVAATEEAKPRIEDMIREDAESRAISIAISHGILDHGPEYDKLTEEDKNEFISIALGKRVRTEYYLDEYMGTLKNEVKTIAMKKATLTAFCAEFIYTSDVTRKSAQRWVNGMFTAGKATATVRRSLSEVRGYWAYLRALEVVPDDAAPFERLVFPTGKEATGAMRKPFTAEEVSALRKAAIEQGNAILADVIDIARWTGARIEEICALPASRVSDGRLMIEDAKTAAGCRTVPIHPRLTPVIERLKEAAGPDGYLIPGLKPNKHGDRSAVVSKWFGRLKKAKKFGEEYVFHSIRHTVSTLLENAGVPENVSADILGHKKTTMTYGLYSGGCSIEVKAAAIARLDYPY